MDTQVLIDSIMRQTTVLIAHLSSAAGLRAPLAHLADEVFLHLSQELEEQGLSRKVVADMFGLALRGYQRRVQRLRESATERGTTLWQALFEFLQEQGPVPRRRILERFRSDDGAVVGAVLNDLATHGLVYRTGSGNETIYELTGDQARAAVRWSARATLRASQARAVPRKRPTGSSVRAYPHGFAKHAAKQMPIAARVSCATSVPAAMPWQPPTALLPMR